MVQESYGGVAELRGSKLDLDRYTKELAMVKRELTGNRYSSEDINNRLKATDNYLEKYIPIKIQTMISQTLHRILKYDEEFKLCQFEEDRFLELTHIVLNDNGIPSLSKKTYSLPQIIYPERPPSSKRLSKTITSKKGLGSTFSGRSNASLPRKSSVAVPSTKDLHSIPTKDRH